MNKLIISHIRKDHTILTIFLMIMILSTFLMNIGLMASKYESLFDEYVTELNLPDYISFIASYFVPDSEDDIEKYFDEADYVESYYMSDVVSFKSYEMKADEDGKWKTQDYLMIQNVDDKKLNDAVVFADRDDTVPGAKLYLNIKKEWNYSFAFSREKK